MALTTVLRNRIQPGTLPRYLAAIQRLAEAARKQQEAFHWGAFQIVYGEDGGFAYVSSADTFAVLEKRGGVAELAARVLGADAPRFLEEVGACIASTSSTVSLDRPDLSYVPRPLAPGQMNAAAVVRAEVRPGLRESYEELLRKIAEAIPKVGDPAQVIVRQTLIGNVSEYTAIRPLRELAELDAQRTPDQLLTQAFGASEGGLIFRNGGAALERIQRSIAVHRPELSNPPA